MITVDIPGYDQLEIHSLVLDYNGTLAIDGIPIQAALEKLRELSKSLQIYVITADTFGTVASKLNCSYISVHLLAAGDQCALKRDFVSKLGAKHTVAIGNGYNDFLMLEEAAIGMALLQAEGVAYRTLSSADLVFPSLVDALDSLQNPTRLTVSLRR